MREARLVFCDRRRRRDAALLVFCDRRRRRDARRYWFLATVAGAATRLLTVAGAATQRRSFFRGVERNRYGVTRSAFCTSIVVPLPQVVDSTGRPTTLIRSPIWSPDVMPVR